MASNSSEQNTAKPVRTPNTAQLREQVLDLARARAGRFTRKRPALHLQVAAVGIAAQFAAAFDQRRVQ